MRPTCSAPRCLAPFRVSARRLGLALLLALFPLSGGAVAQPAETRVTLFHDTHLHGQLEGPDRQTFANYAGLVKQRRAQLPTPTNSLFVGNGDDIAPSLMSSTFGGQQVIDSFNAAGLDADTFGNHEFDLGPARLRELIATSRFGWVSANVRERGSGDVFAADLGVRPWTIKDVGGVRVGLTGLAPTTTPEASSPGPDVEFLDPVAAMREVVPQMRAAGAQVVVLLSHLCGNDTERVAAAVSGIDVAVGDHCSGVLDQPLVVNGTIVARRGDELRQLGQLDLYVAGGRVSRFTYTAVRVEATSPADAGAASVLELYRSRLSAELDAPIGATTVPLEVTRPVMRSGEAAAGNLVADALRAWSGADVALQNGGGVRGERTYGPGVLLKRDAAEMLPFPNYGTVLRVSGATLLRALENGVSQVENEAGRFPQVSGLTFSYDPSAPPNARVRQVSVGDRPLDPNATYRLATLDFLANGGDGYEMLRDAEVLVPPAAGPLLTNVLMDYLAMQGTVSPRVEGRIRAVAGGK